MTCNYAVTFEYQMRAPETHRGTVTAGKPWTVTNRAVREAQKALRPVGWTSVVCVLLDREEHGDVGDGRADLEAGQDG